ncbi:MAG: hypothetical protein IJ901_05695 [Bacteroidaceae bacterium]|nr:hypothetical protein [Bacteroidaceae bacterium]
MNKIISFNKKGHDPFIDFIKAYAIICVLIGHTMPVTKLGYGLWAGMQVPLFVLVQSFHSLKKEKSSLDIKKIVWRIIVPFVFIEILIFLVQYISCMDFTCREQIIYNFIKDGGAGPGSYFPWVYIQISFLLVLIKKVIAKGSLLWLTLISIVICEGFELLSSLIDLPDSLYRLLAIRYFFLIYLGWVYVKKGIVVNGWTFLLSIISGITIIYFEYYSQNDEPLFYNTAWKFHRWPCYFYVANIGVWLLYFIYQKCLHYKMIADSANLLAKCSYEIFLIQMAIIAIFPKTHFVTDKYLDLGLKALIIFLISIGGGFLFNKFYNRLIAKYKLIKNNGIQKSN